MVTAFVENLRTRRYHNQLVGTDKRPGRGIKRNRLRGRRNRPGDVALVFVIIRLDAAYRVAAVTVFDEGSLDGLGLGLSLGGRAIVTKAADPGVDYLAVFALVVSRID